MRDNNHRPSWGQWVEGWRGDGSTGASSQVSIFTTPRKGAKGEGASEVFPQQLAQPNRAVQLP